MSARVHTPDEIETMVSHAYHGLEAGAAERAAVVRPSSAETTSRLHPTAQANRRR